MFEEQVWDLKHEEWTLVLQIIQGTGLELLEKVFFQSSQKGLVEVNEEEG